MTGPVRPLDGPPTGPTVFPAQTLPMTVTFKECGCGVLVGEYCDCSAFAAGLSGAPVVLMPHCPSLAPLTDRALRGAA